MTPDELAKVVRENREARGLSPVTLARKSGLNMLIVGALERGDLSNISVAQLLKLADCLGLQLSLGAGAAIPPGEAATTSAAAGSEASPASQPKPIPLNLQIRNAQAADAEAISELVRSFAHGFTLKPDSSDAQAFMNSISPEGIARILEDADYRYYTGWIGQTLAGVIAVKKGSHLFHWFVRTDMQKRGLGRKLWIHVKSRALATGQRCSFTVNAAVDAVPAYERLGFDATGEVQEKGGLRFVPMQLG